METFQLLYKIQIQSMYKGCVLIHCATNVKSEWNKEKEISQSNWIELNGQCNNENT